MTARVSIVIKAFNEEDHIAAAIDSALLAAATVDGEVILADSASTDRTVDIASRYPVTIVQLTDPSERCCGVGPQLGYQHATGDYVYILDGDMELEAGFMSEALAALARDPDLAGVGGLVEQLAGDASYQFRGLKRRRHERTPGEVPWLDMGGLYRRSALQQAGYFSNRNLHAFEEMELGLRLTAAGWKLRRLPIAGVRHRGYELGTLALLRRRWQTGYLRGAGELLKASWRTPYFWRALVTQKFLLVGLALWLGLLAGLLLLPLTASVLVAAGVALLVLIAARTIRARSLKDALLGQLVWQVHSLAMVQGLVSAAVDPCEPIGSRVIKRHRAPEGPGAAACSSTGR